MLGMLELAVPLWTEKLRHRPWSELELRRDACLEVIGYGDKTEGIACLATGALGKSGQVAQAFNAVAEALAILALQPGGVTFCGLHWEERR